MSHTLIMGMVESGKTTLAKQLAAEYKRNGISVLVLDPLGDPEWCADIMTDDAHYFLQTCKHSRSCAVFIDESGDNVGQHDKEMHWLGTKSRHFGHNVHFIAQRGQQISKTVRDQCSSLFLFNCSLSDSKILSDEWNKPGLLDANSLLKGQFIKCGRFTDLERHQLF